MRKGVGKIICGGVLFVTGMVLPFLFLIPLIFQEDLAVLRAPGSTVVTIDEPGIYCLWHRCNTVHEGKVYSVPEPLPEGFDVTLVDEASGESVLLESGLNGRVQSGSQKKVSVGNFSITKPGKYLLKAAGSEEVRILSLGKSLFGDPVLVIGGFIGLILFSVVTTIGAIALVVIGIINLVKGSHQAVQ